MNTMQTPGTMVPARRRRLRNRETAIVADKRFVNMSEFWAR